MESDVDFLLTLRMNKFEAVFESSRSITTTSNSFSFRGLFRNGFAQSVGIIDLTQDERLKGRTNGGIIPHTVVTVTSRRPGAQTTAESG
jgi:hypothetical protein